MIIVAMTMIITKNDENIACFHKLICSSSKMVQKSCLLNAETNKTIPSPFSRLKSYELWHCLRILRIGWVEEIQISICSPSSSCCIFKLKVAHFLPPTNTNFSIPFCISHTIRSCPFLCIIPPLPSSSASSFSPFHLSLQNQLQQPFFTASEYVSRISQLPFRKIDSPPPNRLLPSPPYFPLLSYL